MRRRDFLYLASTLAGASAIDKINLLADMTQMAPGDPRADSDYLNRRIKHISDADLFAAMELDRAGLETVRQKASAKDYPGAYEAWSAYWRKAAPAREQFTGDGDYLCPRAEAAAFFKAQAPSILAAAGRVLRHDIDGWGGVTIQHGPVVNFNADYGKSGKYGFHYWGWARPLVQAFLITGDDKYLAGFDELFNQWYEQRDQVHGDWPGLDPIWYELGLGVRNRLFLEAYFLDYSNRTIQTHARMLKTLLGAARWLEDEEKLGYREHNWQIVGSYGLAQIGLMMPEFIESAGWSKLGTQRMLEHLAKDFFPDGCHSERCPSSYMILAYRDPRNLSYLLSHEPAERGLAEKMSAPLERSVNFWRGILPPDRVLPGINDGSRAPMPEVILPAKLPPAAGSVHFPASGFTAMRSDDSGTARYLLINHGPYGGGHSHADALSFELNGFGKALAIDSGIGVSYDDPLHQLWYVHSRAHNMITIDGADCDRPAAEGKDVAWTSNSRCDFFAATHHGYEAAMGIIHRRHIVFIKPDYFLIYDRIENKGPKSRAIEFNLHLTTPSDSQNGPGLVVLASDPWPTSRDKGSASVLGIDGFAGRQVADIDWMKFSSPIEAGQTKALGVLLWPFEARRPKVAFRRGESEGDFVVALDQRIDHVSIAHDAVAIR